MKSMPVVLVILSAIILLAACSLINDCSRSDSAVEYPFLTLNLALDKNTYQPGDTIIAQLVLKNMGGQDVLVNKRMVDNELRFPDVVRDVSFLIIGPPSQQALPFALRRHPSSFANEDFVTLLTGETVDATYELQYDYLISYEPGDYIVLAYYKNVSDPDDGRVAWKGELTSNLVIFTIEP